MTDKNKEAFKQFLYWIYLEVAATVSPKKSTPPPRPKTNIPQSK